MDSKSGAYFQCSRPGWIFQNSKSSSDVCMVNPKFNTSTCLGRSNTWKSSASRFRAKWPGLAKDIEKVWGSGSEVSPHTLHGFFLKQKERQTPHRSTRRETIANKNGKNRTEGGINISIPGSRTLRYREIYQCDERRKCYRYTSTVCVSLSTIMVQTIYLLDES